LYLEKLEKENHNKNDSTLKTISKWNEIENLLMHTVHSVGWSTVCFKCL
jgi:hypothetical protein